MPRIVLLLSSIVAALLLAYGVEILNAVKPAEATFPGVNGRIAYSEDDDPTDDGSDEFETGDDEIYTSNPDGTGKLQLTNDDGNDFSPDYSPDGKKIVYVDSDGFSAAQLYIMNADGSGKTRVTQGDLQPQGPAFSPDGTKIAFFSYADSPWESDIFTINTDGTGLFKVTDNNNVDDSWPDWSPKGNKIVYDRGPHNFSDGDKEINTINPDGTGRVQVTSNTTNDQGPEYSPSGNKIVYAGGYPEDGEIFTINTDGTRRVQVTNNKAYDGSPTYSPDGKRIAYTSANQRSWAKLLKIPVGGGTPTLVESHDNSPYGPSSPSWGSQ
jgi:Tol biopolymer transport system component